MSEEKAQAINAANANARNLFYRFISKRSILFMNVLREATGAIQSNLFNHLVNNPDSETLVPVGMGTFVKTKISSKVLKLF